MANMEQCSQGHFFDSSKHTSCPWCGVGTDPDRTGSGGQDKTKNMQGAPTPPPPQPNPPQAGGSGAATRRIVPTPDEPRGFDPVVGWLVCTEGPDRGRDYRLRTAKNFIGRAPEMDSASPTMKPSREPTRGGCVRTRTKEVLAAARRSSGTGVPQWRCDPHPNRARLGRCGQGRTDQSHVRPLLW